MTIYLKKVDVYISTISSWNKIPNVGSDRAKAALQNPLSHQTVESILGLKSEGGFPDLEKKVTTRIELLGPKNDPVVIVKKISLFSHRDTEYPFQGTFCISTFSRCQKQKNPSVFKG